MRKGMRVMLTALLLCGASEAAAQDGPRLHAEVSGGFASFVDDAPVHSGYVGAALRLPVFARIAIGPELVHVRGADLGHQWHLAASAAVDLRRPAATGSRGVVPYVVVAAGVQRQTRETGIGPFTSSEVSVSGGLGVRLAFTNRFFVAPEARVGWEPHYRFGAAMGVRF